MLLRGSEWLYSHEKHVTQLASLGYFFTLFLCTVFVVIGIRWPPPLLSSDKRKVRSLFVDMLIYLNIQNTSFT
ncbi:hypothetical protein QJS04_geneDACA016850 [Acorus gramineus]|uniref:ATP synthase F0 subunit 8 n=1 Tax=Acorus gramineus TaxID=55184 RepID=A0AAV9ARD1_ACOGR|nr:hypothetical protein QJS04_geneDACA016850 [Acorus gramineus]